MIGSHQECSILIETEEPLTARVLEVAWRHGATTYPVGSQSRFETGVMIYRLSRAIREADPTRAARMIRVSPFRAGPDTVVRILSAALADARKLEV
jgi:hypothetical protein